MAGRTIRIFLPDGSPQGLRVAEVGMWTGLGLVCPRADLSRLGKRADARRPGIYLLVGGALGSTPGQRVYVGEGDDVVARLLAHDADPDKEFWIWVVLFVSKDTNLTKAHVRWLEAQLVREIKAAKRVECANGNEPGGGELPDADKADLEVYLDNVRMLLPVLGLDALGPPSDSEPAGTPARDLELTLKSEDASAACVLRNGQFIVRKGSTARAKNVDSLPETYVDLRRQLKDNGVLVPAGPTLMTFTVDYAFDSPSAAGSAVTGTSVNGRTAWRVKGTAVTYKEWQERQDLVDAQPIRTAQEAQQ
jgi:hypothetical protein